MSPDFPPDAPSTRHDSTLTVGASNSLNPELADYECDGAADEVEINAALAALPASGGRVILFEGTYTLSTGIDFTANSQVLEGEGRATFLDGDALLTGEHAINLSGFTDCTMRNLSVQTEDGGGKTCYCIFIEDGADRFVVDGVIIVNSDLHGVQIEGTRITVGWITNCVFLDVDFTAINTNADAVAQSHLDIHIHNNHLLGGAQHGINLIRAQAIMVNNYITGFSDIGIYLQSTADYSIIENNMVFDVLDQGILAGGLYISVVGNTVWDCGKEGIYVNGDYYTVTGNISHLNMRHGIYLAAGSTHCTISSNIVSENDSGDTATYDGIYVAATATDNIISNNNCYGNHRYGINSDGTRNNITGNTCSANDRHGIVVNDLGCKVTSNFCYFNGADAVGTYHGIYVGGSATGTTVIGNTCSDDGARQEDGIHLADGASGCIINSNFCYNNMGSGIALTANNDVCLINGNSCFQNDDHGIELTASSVAHLISQNYCVLNGGYGIQLTATSDYNTIQGNYTNQNVTGSINIAAATCDNNQMAFNTVEEGAPADAGTNTRSYGNYDPSANAFVGDVGASPW